MIVNIDDKGFQTRSDKPNSNWMGEGWLVVEDGSELANKIMRLAPYVELVIENEVLVDVIETERPEPEVVITQDEINVDFDYRLCMLELGLV